MNRRNVIRHFFWALVLCSISVLTLTACGGDSGPTPGGLAITSTSLPEGDVNQPYSTTLGASGGEQPYLWSVTPALPAGLSLNTRTGEITGTPTTTGTTSHIFTLADSSIPPQTVETTLNLTVTPPLSITTTSLPAGNIGAVYDRPVQTIGGHGPLTFSITVGTLPPGLNLNPTTGAISGTATAIGNSSFTVRVADTSGQQDTQAFSIRIDPQSPPQITTASLPAGTVGLPYSQQVQASAGIGALTWSISAGTLPPGLTIGPTSTGSSVTISGTPTSQGTSNFTLRVTDTLGQFATRALSITVNLPASPNITTTTLPAGTIAQTYNQAVLATGTAPLTWSISAGTLPPGLNFSTTSGTITGAPTATGSFPFTVRVADTFGQADTQALTLVVSTDNPPQITTGSLPGGLVSQPYNQTIQTTGGNGTLTWNISAGSLPPGLAIGPPLTGPTVTISGTPTSQGTFPLTVRVVDSLGQVDTQALSITISLPTPPNITTTSLPAGTLNELYSQTIGVTGGGAPLTWSISAGTLPPGLTLNGPTIAGTPTATGTSNFTVRVVDAAGQDDTQALSIVINPSNPPQIAPSSLPNGTVNVPYGPATLQATGGIGTLTWSITPGSLPAGLTLGPPVTGSSVTISGTPTSQGTANFTVRVTDSLGQFDTQALSIQINAAAPPPSPPATVTVNKSGTGTGTVTSSPSGINCGATCSAPFPTSSSVTLTATPSADSDFIAWSGACTGAANCTFTVTADTAVGAQFNLKPTP